MITIVGSRFCVQAWKNDRDAIESMSTETPKLRIIVTGATGMVGEGVLLECLDHPAVDQVLMVNRKPYPRKHPKLSELIVPDFLHLDGAAAQLAGYDSCFYCAGISSRGMSEADYTHITYDITVHFAQNSRKPESADDFRLRVRQPD